MLRIKPASYQDQTKSDTVWISTQGWGKQPPDRELVPKGNQGRHSGRKNNSKNEYQDFVSYTWSWLFVCLGGGRCMCACMRVCIHACTSNSKNPAFSGNQNSLQSPSREQKAALSCVYEQPGPRPHVCGSVMGSCPWPDVPHTKRASSQCRAWVNYSWAQESSTARKAPTPSNPLSRELLVPSGPRLPLIPWPVQGLQCPSLSHALWKAHWLPLLMCSRRWVSIPVRCHHLSCGDDAPSPRGWGETGEVHRCAVWMVAACSFASRVVLLVNVTIFISEGQDEQDMI